MKHSRTNGAKPKHDKPVEIINGLKAPLFQRLEETALKFDISASTTGDMIEVMLNELDATTAILQEQDGALNSLHLAFGIESGTYDGQPDLLVQNVVKIHEAKLADVWQLVQKALKERDNAEHDAEFQKKERRRTGNDVAYWRTRAEHAEKLLQLQANNGPVTPCGVGSDCPF